MTELAEDPRDTMGGADWPPAFPVPHEGDVRRPWAALPPPPAPDGAHAHPFPGNVLMHIAGMGRDSEGMTDADQETRTVVESPDHAVVVTSLRHGSASPFEPTSVHRPVIDIDWPVTVVPSRTEGHSHVYIDKTITWEQYLGVLDALAAAGIVETGYVKAARTRGHTAVRVPWVSGDYPSVPLPAEQEQARARGVDFYARKLIRAIRSATVPDKDAELIADELAVHLGGVGERVAK